MSRHGLHGDGNTLARGERPMPACGEVNGTTKALILRHGRIKVYHDLDQLTVGERIKVYLVHDQFDARSFPNGLID